MMSGSFYFSRCDSVLRHCGNNNAFLLLLFVFVAPLLPLLMAVAAGFLTVYAHAAMADAVVVAVALTGLALL